MGPGPLLQAGAGAQHGAPPARSSWVPSPSRVRTVPLQKAFPTRGCVTRTLRGAWPRAAEPSQPVSPLKEHALGVLVVCLASIRVPQEHVWGRVSPLGQCVCVFPGRVWLPGRVVAHRGPLLPPQPKPSFEQSKKETQRAAAPTAPAEGPPGRQEQEAEKQAALNKGTVLALQVLLQQAPQACPGHGEISAQRSPALPQHRTWLVPCPPVPGDAQPGVSLCPAVGIVPPRTKSPPEEEVVPAGSMLRRSAGGMANGLGSKARPLARG